MNSVSGLTYYEINVIKNKSLLRRGKNPAPLRHIKCCSQLAPFLWTSQSTSRWEIIKVLIKLVLHASGGTFLFCKAFPSAAQSCTHKGRGFFFPKDLFFFVVALEVLWLQEDEGGGGGHLWKGIFLFIHIYALGGSELGVWILFLCLSEE